MAPKWHQNRPKMAPRWPLGGSWGHLVGKLAPRWSQEGSKVEKLNSFPCWGPSFRHFQHQGCSQEAWRPTWMTCCVQTPSFRRNVVSQSSLRHKKYSKTAILSSKSRFSAFHLKWLWGWVLGSLLGRFWDPSWGQVGPCWAPSWLTMALEHDTKKMVVKKSRGPTQKIPRPR